MIGGMKLRSAAVVLAALLPSAVAAQTMDFACPDPGTTFTYDSGTKVVAKGRDGMDCSMEIVGGKPYKLRALLFDNPSTDGRDMSAFLNALKPERLWPLEIGKRSRRATAAGGQTWNYILTMVRYEKRTGPGEAMIDTFVIEMQERAATVIVRSRAGGFRPPTSSPSASTTATAAAAPTAPW